VLSLVHPLLCVKAVNLQNRPLINRTNKKKKDASAPNFFIIRKKLNQFFTASWQLLCHLFLALAPLSINDLDLDN
jgi:hypothetical protein